MDDGLNVPANRRAACDEEVANGFALSTLVLAVDENCVILVNPGRDCASAVGERLDAVVALSRNGRLGMVIFFDDGSEDETVAVVDRCLTGKGAERVLGALDAGYGPRYARGSHVSNSHEIRRLHGGVAPSVFAYLKERPAGRTLRPVGSSNASNYEEKN